MHIFVCCGASDSHIVQTSTHQTDINSSPPSDAYMHQENRGSIGSDNGLLPIQRQAII